MGKELRVSGENDKYSTVCFNRSFTFSTTIAQLKAEFCLYLYAAAGTCQCNGKLQMLDTSQRITVARVQHQTIL